MPAQLLVSVRSAQEAAAALDGGADIIDVKEPRRGSLGRCDPAVLGEIVDLVRRCSPELSVSAALGEAHESDGNPWPADSLLQSLDLVKCGLSRLLPADSDWSQAWLKFRRQILPPAVSGPRWVAVSYADAERSGAPRPLDVLEQGHRTGCPVLLIDTFEKDGSSLFDWIDVDALMDIRQRTQTYDMKLALAGGITLDVLPQVVAVCPDIVAVRGAACDQGERTATVSADRVRQLADAIRNANVICPVPGAQHHAGTDTSSV